MFFEKVDVFSWIVPISPGYIQVYYVALCKNSNVRNTVTLPTGCYRRTSFSAIVTRFTLNRSWIPASRVSAIIILLKRDSETR